MIHLLFSSASLGMLCISALILLAGRWRPVRAVCSGLLVIALMVGTAVAGISFWRGDRLAIDLSQLTPLPFAVAVDRLSAFFLLLICSIGAAVTVFSRTYAEHHYQGRRRD